MDRFALFVDAGYLLAAGSVLRVGTPNRGAIDCDYEALVRSLLEFVRGHSHVELLRVYWYDAAPDAVPTTDQIRVGNLPDVKLRLGRLIGGRQKGVDSLILRDLMTLGRERAIVTGYLLGGDEDLREGVVAAQDMGVRVVLMGVDTDYTREAATLVREADEHVILPEERWQPFFSPRPVQEQLLEGVAQAVPAAEAPATVEETRRFFEEGQVFGRESMGRLEARVIEGIRAQFPAIPPDLDAEMLRRAAHGTVLDDDARKSLRRGFWSVVRPRPG